MGEMSFFLSNIPLNTGRFHYVKEGTNVALFVIINFKKNICLFIYFASYLSTAAKDINGKVDSEAARNT